MISFDAPIDIDATTVATDRAPERIGVISSLELLANRKLIHIQHRGEVYSLRETRLGKLILTK